MKWAFVMQPDMKVTDETGVTLCDRLLMSMQAEDIYDFQSINDNLDRKQLTATRPLDAEVGFITCMHTVQVLPGCAPRIVPPWASQL